MDFADRLAPPFVVSSNTKITGCAANLVGSEIVFVEATQADVPAKRLADDCPIAGTITSPFFAAVMDAVELTVDGAGDVRTICGVTI